MLLFNPQVRALGTEQALTVRGERALHLAAGEGGPSSTVRVSALCGAHS